MPVVLPSAAAEAGPFRPRLFRAVCRISSAGAPGLQSLALDALECLVETCPQEGVEPLLGDFHSTFASHLEGGDAAAHEPSTARAAACCWAAAAGALLRRGGFGQQAGAFLNVLLEALKQREAPVAPFIPGAFHVLMPPRFDAQGEAGAEGATKLPPLALQQLSRTVLPSLVGLAKDAAKGSDSPGSAALKSAVALLCALSPQVLCTDCSDDLRWCALTGLKCLGDESSGSIFSVQVLQLLLRAARHPLPWVEDDLSSVVPPLLGACTSHPVPLVRMGSLQGLHLLVKSSLGHLLPFKRQLEVATRKATEDGKREVRLLAVTTLNAWHCGLTVERD